MRVPDAAPPPPVSLRVVPVSTPIAAPPKPAPSPPPPPPVTPPTRKRFDRREKEEARAARRREKEEEKFERRSVQRPPSRGRFPVWIAVGGGVFALTLLVCLASSLYFGLRDAVPGPPLGSVPGDGPEPLRDDPVRAATNPLDPAATAVREALPAGWTRVKVNGDTAMTIAVPNPYLAPGVQRQHPNPRFRVCTHGRVTTAAHGEMTFLAEYFTENPINIDPNSLPPDLQPVRRYHVEGHEVWVNRPREFGGGVTHVQFGVFVENGKIVNGDISGRGITLDTPEVRRCLDSISFTLPATPGAVGFP